MLNRSINFLSFFMILFFISCEKEESASADPTDSTDTVEEVDPCAVDPVYVSFQSEIDAASDGDTILVAPGTYEGNINFNGKNVVVASEYVTTGDSSYIKTTIIDAKQNGSVVRFENNETNQAALIGFTITGGYAVKGAGIYISGGAEPTLSNLRVSGNSTYICETDDYYDEAEGGGIYVNGGSPILEETTIRDNSSELNGGGLYFANTDLDLIYVTVVNNDALNWGGGLFTTTTNSKIKHTDISLNSASRGGAIYAQTFSDLIINNSTFSSNLVSDEGGAFHNTASTFDFVNVAVAYNESDGQGGAYFMNGTATYELMNVINLYNEPQDFYGANSGNFVKVDYSGVTGLLEGIEMNNSGDVQWGTGNIDDDGEENFSNGPHLCVYAFSNDSGSASNKSQYSDAGNPSFLFNDIPYTDRWCAVDEYDAFTNQGLPGIDVTVDTSSNSQRNDMGAYGGPQGGWKRNSR